MCPCWSKHKYANTHTQANKHVHTEREEVRLPTLLYLHMSNIFITCCSSISQPTEKRQEQRGGWRKGEGRRQASICQATILRIFHIFNGFYCGSFSLIAARVAARLFPSVCMCVWMCVWLCVWLCVFVCVYWFAGNIDWSRCELIKLLAYNYFSVIKSCLFEKEKAMTNGAGKRGILLPVRGGEEVLVRCRRGRSVACSVCGLLAGSAVSCSMGSHLVNAIPGVCCCCRTSPWKSIKHISNWKVMLWASLIPSMPSRLGSHTFPAHTVYIMFYINLTLNTQVCQTFVPLLVRPLAQKLLSTAARAGCFFPPGLCPELLLANF